MKRSLSIYSFEQDVDYKLQKDVSIAALDTTANYYS